MVNPFWLILLLPLISAMACLMDSDVNPRPRQMLLRVLRWDAAFLLAAGIEYFLIFE